MDWLSELADLETCETARVGRKSKSERKACRREEFKEKRRVKRRERIYAQRKIDSAARHAFLDAMSTEDRIEYIRIERLSARQRRLATEERLERNLDNGELKICIHCGFMDTMMQKEQHSLAKQIQYLYNNIKKNDSYSVSLTLACFSDQLKSQCETFGYNRWRIRQSPLPPSELYETDRVIVLSPDADETLTHDELFDGENVFVIGGIVDRSVRKSETRVYAQQRELRARRLPLEACALRVYPVLNVNAVADILAAIRFDGLDWSSALLKYTPSRRHAEKRVTDIKLESKSASEDLASESIDEDSSGERSDTSGCETRSSDEDICAECDEVLASST